MVDQILLAVQVEILVRLVLQQTAVGVAVVTQEAVIVLLVLAVDQAAADQITAIVLDQAVELLGKAIRAAMVVRALVTPCVVAAVAVVKAILAYIIIPL